MFEQHSNKIYNSLQNKHAIYFSIQKNLSIIVIQVRNRLLNREKMIFAISNKTLQII